MGFLRRLLGGGDADPTRSRSAAAGDGMERPDGAPDGPGAEPGTDEAARDRELLRSDGERLSDELLQRQLRYADRSWTPPRQGGERRAEDDDPGRGDAR